MIPSQRLLGHWRQILILAGKSRSLTTSARTLTTKKMPAAGETDDCPVTKAPRLADFEKPVVLKFSKLTDDAFTPAKGSKQAAGYDLYSAYNYVVEPKGKVLAKTDLQIALPDGCYGRIAPRSGLALKHFIDVGAGVIDQDYRGNVGVILFNFGTEEFKVQKGDRIAQLILERIYLPELLEVDTLNDTERGEGGFGSSGKN